MPNLTTHCLFPSSLRKIPTITSVLWLVLLANLFVLSSCALYEPPKFNDNLLTPAAVPTIASEERFPQKQPDASAGAQIYAQKCAACHGAQGKGDGQQSGQLSSMGKLAANLVDDGQRRAATPQEWHNTITRGRIQNLMPPFQGSLNAQQRWDVQAYLWTLAFPQDRRVATEQRFQQTCASCHQPNTSHSLVSLEKMASTTLLETAQAIQQTPAHAKLKLTKQDRLGMADYVRSLHYAYVNPQTLQKQAQNGKGELVVSVQTDQPLGSTKKLVLKAYDNVSNGAAFTRTAEITQGKAVFANLPITETYFYQAELVHEQTTFFATAVQLTQTELASATLKVFQTTDRADQVVFPEVYYFVRDINAESASVVEVYMVSNRSKKAYYVKSEQNKARSLKIELPSNASNIRFDPPQLTNRMRIDNNTVFYNDLIEPGEQVVSFSVLYEIPYKNRAVVTRTWDYPVENWRMLLPDFSLASGTPLTATGLIYAGKQETPNGRFHLFRLEQPLEQLLPAKQLVQFELNGQPTLVPPPGSDTRSLLVALASFVLLVGSGVWLLRWAKKSFFQS